MFDLYEESKLPIRFYKYSQEKSSLVLIVTVLQQGGSFIWNFVTSIFKLITLYYQGQQGPFL